MERKATEPLATRNDDNGYNSRKSKADVNNIVCKASCLPACSPCLGSKRALQTSSKMEDRVTVF